jgi:hypothetical protein
MFFCFGMFGPRKIWQPCVWARLFNLGLRFAEMEIMVGAERWNFFSRFFPNEKNVKKITKSFRDKDICLLGFESPIFREHLVTNDNFDGDNAENVGRGKLCPKIWVENVGRRKLCPKRWGVQFVCWKLCPKRRAKMWGALNFVRKDEAETIQKVTHIEWATRMCTFHKIIRTKQ